MAIELPAAGITCHHTGHARPCRDLAAGCPLYQQIEGKDQNGQKIAGWGCADAYLLSGLAGVIQKLDRVDAEISAMRAEIRKRATGTVPPAPAQLAPPTTLSDPSGRLQAGTSLIEQAAEKGDWG